MTASRLGWPRPDAAHVPPAQFGTPRAPLSAHWASIPPSLTPPPPPNHRGRWGALLVFGVALLVLGLVMQVAQWGIPVPNIVPSTPPPAAQGKPTTSAETRLMANPLYSLKISGRCPAQLSPSTRGSYEAQVQGLLDCLVEVYRPLLDEAGLPFREVRHTYFDATISTPCGEESEQFAFYCEQNSTIYLSEDVYESAANARLLVADVVIHEYAHHVQSMIGLFSAEDGWAGATAVQRREELQVFCWTYYTLENVEGFDVNSDDRRWFYQVMGVTDDPKGHGSVKAQQRWGMRGLHGENFGACNTWAATPDEVD